MSISNPDQFMEPLLGPATHIHNVWKLWEGLFFVPDDHENVSLINDAAPIFFAVVYPSLQDDVMLSLARLNDRETVCGKPTYVLSRIVRDLGLAANDPRKRQLEKLVDDFRRQCDAITEFRHEVLAHNGYQPATQGWKQSGTKAPKIIEIRDAVQLLIRIVNEVAEVAHGHSVDYSGLFPSQSFGARQILAALKSAEELRDARTAWNQ